VSGGGEEKQVQSSVIAACGSNAISLTLFLIALFLGAGVKAGSAAKVSFTLISSLPFQGAFRFRPSLPLSFGDRTWLLSLIQVLSGAVTIATNHVAPGFRVSLPLKYPLR
jgi:hypothetical protein